MLARRSVLGLFKGVDEAADALDAVRAGGFEQNEYEILTGTPYPEGAFGEEEAKHSLYRYPLIGAACGFIIGLVGCYEGMRVSGSAESVGRMTTRAVVEAIFLVIVLDAMFSILFAILGV